MGQFIDLNDIANGVVAATPILVPDFAKIQAENRAKREASQAASSQMEGYVPNTSVLSPGYYDYQSEAKNTALMQGYRPEEAMAPDRAPHNIEAPTETQNENPTETPTGTSEGSSQPAGSTGDQGADAMIAELMKLDDGTLRGAERMVQNFDAIAAAYAQRTGRNMQADLFSLQPGRRRETEYTPFLNPRNY